MLPNDLVKTIESLAKRVRQLEVRQLGSGGGPPGAGDMTKAVYDPDTDNVVEAADYAATAGSATTAGNADTVDGSHAAAFALSGHVHAGMGDMTKAVYDTDNDNKVESADYADTAGSASTAGDADTVDGSHAAAFSLSGHTHAQLHDAVTLAADADAILGLTGQQLTLDSQNANKVLAGPATGADADPAFRALVAADVGSGVPDGTKFLRDDMSWQAVPAGPGGSVDGTLALFGLLGWV